MTEAIEKPILFSGPMVRAILNGTKTVTRRIVTPNTSLGLPKDADLSRAKVGAPPVPLLTVPWTHPEDSPADERILTVYPRIQVGMRLWVRETWGALGTDPPGVVDGRKPQLGDDIRYCADPDQEYQWRNGSLPWRPSIHMPRWACRLLLDVTSVRVDRLQDITEDDATAEGVDELDGSLDEASLCQTAKTLGGCPEDARTWFVELWNSINAKRGFGWGVNPWVWRIEFRKVEA